MKFKLKKSHVGLTLTALFATALAVPAIWGVMALGQEAQAAETRTVGKVIDDSVITAKVKSALLTDSEVNGFDFKVDTRKGVVILSGFVDNQAQVDRAIALAVNVEGVARVESKVNLKSGTTSLGTKVDDGILTTKVKTALLSDPDVKGVQIAVVTRQGVVQLSGFVDSRNQAERAIQIVRGTAGVHGVDNELTIKN